VLKCLLTLDMRKIAETEAITTYDFALLIILKVHSSVGGMSKLGSDQLTDTDENSGRGRDCFLLHSFQTSSVAHSASYPVGARVSFPRA
jgi:hypothetical protein